MKAYITETYIPRLKKLKEKVHLHIDVYQDKPTEFKVFLDKELQFFYRGTRNQVASLKTLDNKYTAIFTFQFIESYLLNEITNTVLDLLEAELKESNNDKKDACGRQLN